MHLPLPRTRGLQERAATWLGRFVATLSTPGLLVATLFFAASLTPSLLPRTLGMQGVLSGISLAAGYGVGVFGRMVWAYLELPLPGARVHRVVVVTAAGISAATAILFLRTAAEWQNSIRLLMGVEAVDSAHPFRVGVMATVVAVTLLGVGRLFQLTFRVIRTRLDRHIPRRVANVLGGALALTLFWSVVNGVLLQSALRAMDSSFRQVDALVEPDVAAPLDPRQAGSAASLLVWEDLGRRGREFVSQGVSQGELRRYFGERAGEPPQQPLRVYVGLNSAGTVRERAELALAELQRAGAFQRSVLLLVTPTGTGWVDPAAVESLEYLHRGDVASVAVQYSYLPSWLSLLVEPEVGEETAREVFSRIYDHWTRMPPASRPALYLHGLSLGALNSERSLSLYDVIGDPISGALWSGPPFRSVAWRTRTAQRDPESPAWLPRFRDGSVVRFMNQTGVAGLREGPWGPLRIVYLQYASDPISFFRQSALYRQPEWMIPPRGPDLSPDLRWYPVVTMLQLAVDMVAADAAPLGFGHVYAPEHYVDAWVTVTDPDGWTRGELDRLKFVLRVRREASLRPVPTVRPVVLR